MLQREIVDKDKEIKEKSRPGGQHSPRTVTFSRVTLDLLEETSQQLVSSSSNDKRRGNMDTHHPSREQASSRTNKDGKDYVKHHIPGQKYKYLDKRKDKGNRCD